MRLQIEHRIVDTHLATAHWQEAQQWDGRHMVSLTSMALRSAVILLLRDTLYDWSGTLGLAQFNDASTHEDVIGLLNRTILLFARRQLFAPRPTPV